MKREVLLHIPPKFCYTNSVTINSIGMRAYIHQITFDMPTPLKCFITTPIPTLARVHFSVHTYQPPIFFYSRVPDTITPTPVRKSLLDCRYGCASKTRPKIQWEFPWNPSGHPDDPCLPRPLTREFLFDFWAVYRCTAMAVWLFDTIYLQCGDTVKLTPTFTAK